LPSFPAVPYFIAQELQALFDPGRSVTEAADSARRGIEGALRWLVFAAIAEEWAAPAAKPWVLDALRALQHPTLSQWVTHARRFAKSRGGELAVR
jgi:hypothetical protein